MGCTPLFLAILSLGALILGLLCVFAGHPRNFMIDHAIVKVCNWYPSSKLIS